MKDYLLNILLLALSCFLLLNCKSPIEQKLTEKESFWYIFPDEDKNDMYENLNYGYEFYSWGKLDYKNFDFSSNSLKSFRMDDVKQDLTWKYLRKENKIRIESHMYDIISFEKDTLILHWENKEAGIKKKKILINLRNKNPKTLESVTIFSDKK